MPDFDDFTQHSPQEGSIAGHEAADAARLTDRPFLQMFFDVAQGEGSADR